MRGRQQNKLMKSKNFKIKEKKKLFNSRIKKMCYYKNIMRMKWKNR